MQQRPPFAPSAAFNFLLAAALGLPGLYDLAMGVAYRTPGAILTGLGATAYSILLVRDALHIRKTGQPLMGPKRMAKVGFVCLAVYVLGVVLKFAWAP